MNSGIIVVNKPKDFTSRDVVNKLTKILHTKKIGHTGTLDPLATGVLICCIGECTKLCDLLTSEYKEYIATIKLGISTDTLDITGNILKEEDIPNLDKKTIVNTLKSFLGKSIQTTPIYSAVKVNGKKLYEYAREGKKVKLPTREIDITNIELLSFNNNEIRFKTTVSKGTYIRALIKNISDKLGTIGTMSELERTKQGNFSIADSYSLNQIEQNKYKMISKEEILSSLETIVLNKELFEKVRNGAIICKNFIGDLVCYKYNNQIVAIYQTYAKDNTKAKPYIMFSVGE